MALRRPLSSASRASGAWSVQEALDGLKRHASRGQREALARYAIPSDKALGVSMANIQRVARTLARNHDLALELWETGVYEARLLAAYVDDSAAVSSAQMDRWCRGFDNWAVCDTVCFALFDRTPHAWRKVGQWANRREEFVKRAAFALLWGLSVHDKAAADEPFMRALRLVEREAADERNFVKKAVNMALRAIGKRSRALNRAAVSTARSLTGASDDTARWVGETALRELTSAAVLRRLDSRSRKGT